MDEKQYAGFWIRVCAQLIDLLFWTILVFIPLTYIYGEEYWTGEQFFFGLWDALLGYVFPFVATVWFWLKFFGTPGKMLLKLRIVDENTGNKLSLGQATGRYFAYIPAMLPLGLGIIFIARDKKKQGMHDKLAKTVVIKSN